MKNKKLLVLLIIILVLGITTAVCWSCTQKRHQKETNQGSTDDDADTTKDDESEEDLEEEDDESADDSAVKNDSDNVEDSVTSDVKKVTVTYYTDKAGSLVFKKDAVEYGKASTFSSIPEQDIEGNIIYIFDKWVLKNGAAANLSKITKDISVYAEYTRTQVQGYKSQKTVTVMDTVPLNTDKVTINYKNKQIAASSVYVTDGTEEIAVVNDSFVASDWNKDYTAIYTIKLPNGKTAVLKTVFDVTHKWYHNLNGLDESQTSICLTGLDTVKIAGKNETVAYASARAAYNYPNAVFPESDCIKWKSDTALTFKVYNPTVYDYNFEIHAFKTGASISDASQIGKSSAYIQGVTVHAKESTTITVYGSMFDASVYPYLGIYACYPANGGIPSERAGGERMASMKLCFYGFEQTTATQPVTEDYKWTLTSSLSDVFAGINTDQDYIKNGEYSIFWTPVGNYPSFVMTESAEIPWSLAEDFSFKVYNPSAYTQKLTLTRDTTKIADYSLQANSWTEIKITDLSGWADGDILRFSTEWRQNLDDTDTEHLNDASNRQWVAYKNSGLYLDDFQVHVQEGISARFDKIAYCIGDTVSIPSAVYVEDFQQHDCTVTKVTYGGNAITVTNGTFRIDEAAEEYVIHYTYNGNKVCELPVEVSKTKYYELNANMSNTVFMNTNVEKITVKDKTYYASSASARKAYNYPSAVFINSDSIVWNTDKTVTFKVYNPTDYTYNFNIRAYKGNSPVDVTALNVNTVLLRGVTIPGKEEVTVTIYASMFDASVYPYLGIETSYQQNGHIASEHTGGERMLNMKLYFYDFVEGTGIEPTDNDYKWVKTSSLSAAFTAVNTNKEYITDGEYSFFFLPAGNWPSFVINESQNVDWTQMGSLSFKVYNPSSYVQHITLTRGTTTVGEYELAAKAWTTIKVTSLADWVANETLRISTGYVNNIDKNDADYIANGKATVNNGQWLAYREHGLYFDAFELEEKPTVSYMLTGMVGNNFYALSGVETITVDNKTEAATYVSYRSDAYVHPHAVFVGSDKIDWSDNKKLTFKIYNPSDYGWSIDLRAYTAEYATKESNVVIKTVLIPPKQVQTVTIYSSEFDASTYPNLGIFYSYNRCFDDKAIFANYKLYCYDFVEETGVPPTSDDYKWTKTTDILSGHQTGHSNVNSVYVKDGDYSLLYIPTGAWPRLSLDASGEIPWTRVSEFAFQVYNPTNYELKITLGHSSDKTNFGTNVGTYTLAPNAWTTVTITDFTNWKDYEYIQFATDYTQNQDAGDATTGTKNRQWQAYVYNGIYLDAFEVKY